MSLSPMMQQYMLLKEQYKDCLLFFRLGDFYEMFFDDAKIASKELELTLTGRDCGLEERAPMCGVPHHSVEGYIGQLIDKGHKVAICEQLSEPSESKGLVARDVVRVITPGTIIETSMLDERKNNYLLCVYKNADNLGLAYADVSTGDFYIALISAKDHFAQLKDQLALLAPNEIITHDEMLLATQSTDVNIPNKNLFYHYDEKAFALAPSTKRMLKQFNAQSLNELGCKKMPEAVCAAGALLSYLEETQKVLLLHINRLHIIGANMVMSLDSATRRNLELTETIINKGKKGSLIWLLDRTQTAMGGRTLRLWLDQPLQDVEHINMRLLGVEELYKQHALRDELRMALDQVYDIERLSSRIAYGTVNARDCLALQQSLLKVPQIKQLLSSCTCEHILNIYTQLDPLTELCALLTSAIAENPPLGVKEGGIIRDGYHDELDELRRASTEGKNWIAALEAQERELTGIKTLKVGYNRVFGYYIEVTKSYLELVPYRYQRKQTTSNAERYITEDLKEIEEKIIGAEEKSVRLEYQLFLEIREKLNSTLIRIQQTARTLATVDALQSLATVALENDYHKPEVHTGNQIEIVDGRHPVVEKALAWQLFVPNNTRLDGDENHMLIITGPNMAGKSTYMRQVALITLMAHMGSFVPAKSAKISLVDRIFTRVGASDDLSSGQSTFMVEMSEMAHILHCATPNSLILLDEIGRGTSTFDGLSIAWAVVEHLCAGNLSGAKTLFATHYHELSELEGRLNGVKNYCIAVKEHGEDIIFLRKIIRGGADKSFGVQVAKLAGLPSSVIQRAMQIMQKLEDADINHAYTANIIREASATMDAEKQTDLMAFSAQRIQCEIVDQLKDVDISEITPLYAMNLLSELIEKARRA